MNSKNFFSIIMLCIMVVGFTVLYLKDNSSPGSHTVENEKLLNAIVLLTENINQSNQQMSHSGYSLNNPSKSAGDNVLINVDNTTGESGVTGDNKYLEISVPKPRQDFSNGPPDMIIISPTVEQNKIYENLKASLDDPSYSENLSLIALKNLPEMKQLDGTMQVLILNKAVEKFNNGEISKETFLAGMKSTN